MSVLEAAEREIAGLPEDLREGVLAATLRELAAQLDAPGNSLTSKSAAAGQVHAIVDRLRELAPPAEEEDDIDELAKQRDRRRARVAGTQDLSVS